MKRVNNLFFFFVVLTISWASTGNAEPLFNDEYDGIRPYRENTWYWEYKSKPILLRGGTNDDNIWQWTGKELTDHLDLLVSVGGNYLRNTMSDRDEGNEFAFKKLESGKYDLDQWNEKYWDRFAFFLEEANKRDIIVQITFWDWFDLMFNQFEVHPLNPKNNVTLDAAELTGRDDYYGGSIRTANTKVLDLQKKYVDKILSMTFGYDNILYNISNESSLGMDWEFFWAQYIKSKAEEISKPVFITSMNLVPSTGVRQVMMHKDLFSFAEISQNNQDSRGARGENHYRNLLQWRKLIQMDPQGPFPMNNEKIYGAADGMGMVGSIAGTSKDAEDRFWKNVFGGAASMRFHRNEGNWGLGLNERAQKNLKALDLFLKEFDVFSSHPYEEIELIGASEGYALAIMGEKYAVYLPPGQNALRLDPWTMNESFTIKFLDIETGEWSDEKSVSLDWTESELDHQYGYEKGLLVSRHGGNPIESHRPTVAIIEVNN
ncbi:hypothetical protein [Arthrospiribacter ruber]|uniref:Collagen-binding domain-containing protein n=1 Tax=Arthrospiribacter ruber TaxID=2487934 RepID=A0A951MBQ7_9BACT|nr:hypothetical protein [Arthrospiribacter ruber]MBW3467007.1 hypothetical protein [Arthrospiribacter ruber]